MLQDVARAKLLETRKRIFLLPAAGRSRMKKAHARPLPGGGALATMSARGDERNLLTGRAFLLLLPRINYLFQRKVRAAEQ